MEKMDKQGAKEAMPGNMDMMMESGEMFMPQSFYWGTKVTVFLEALQVNSVQGLLIAAGTFLILSCANETFKCLRVTIAKKHGNRDKGISILSREHVIHSSLFFFDFIFNYILMLVVMTFNAWLFVAIITGSFVGTQICRLLRYRQEVRDEAAITADKVKKSCASKRAAAEGDPNAPERQLLREPDEKRPCGTSYAKFEEAREIVQLTSTI